MEKRIYTILLGTMLTFLTGCSSSTTDSNNSKIDEPKTTLGDNYTLWTVAKNSSVQETSKVVDTNTIKVLVEPGKQIGEDATSNTVDFVFGKINGENIGLGINQNYNTGTKMVVRIYNEEGKTLATSKILTHTGADNNLEFNDISF